MNCVKEQSRLWLLLVYVGVVCSGINIESYGKEMKMELLPYVQALSNTSCTRGLKRTVDKIFLKAFAVAKENESIWNTSIDVQVKRKLSQTFQKICSSRFLRIGCGVGREFLCMVCVVYSTNNMAVLSLWITSRIDLSQSQVRLRWIASQGGKTQSTYTNIVQLPVIYGPEGLVLTLNHVEVDIKTGGCNFSLTRCKNNIRLCCQDTPQPCRVQVSYGDSLTRSEGTCVEITKTHNDTGIYTFSYSTCGGKLNTIYTCTANTDPEVDKTSLRVNLKEIDLKTNSCEFPLATQKSNVDYCCHASECLARIRFGDIQVEDVSCTRLVQYQKDVGNYTFYASICNGDVQVSYRCFATVKAKKAADVEEEYNLRIVTLMCIFTLLFGPYIVAMIVVAKKSKLKKSLY